MFDRAKAWIIKKLGGPVAPVVPAGTSAPVKKPMHISRALLERMSEQMVEAAKVPFVEYAAPKLPPGVVPTIAPTKESGLKLAHDEAPAMALDSAAPVFGWLNQYQQFGCGLFFPGYPYLAELTQISEYRAPSETTSTEMTRKWLEHKSKSGGDKSEKIAKIDARMKELKVRELFERAALLDGEFGRAQIILNIKGQDGPEARQLPLTFDSTGIQKGSLLSLQCIEPYWSTPYSWNAMYPEREDFYKPQSWYIMGRKTHSTRILTFIGREVPDLLKPAYNFGGISLTQLMQPYVAFWLRTRKAVNDLINNFSITVISTDMSATLQEGSDGTSFLNRLKLFIQGRNNQGVGAINKDTEELVQVNTPLSGLSELQAQSQEHMASPGHIPLIKMFGITPTGLGATGEGEIQCWYDWIGAFQGKFFGPHYDKLLIAVQCDLFGEVDDDITYQWVNLDEPTQKELAEIRKSDADAGTGYINAGVIAPEEERERLQDDPDSGYSNLSGPAPEPPEPEGAPGEGGEGEGDEPESMGIDAAFDESKFEEGKHKRADNGEFGSGGGGASEKPKGAKLTANEKSTLASYSGDDFLRLNKALREDDDSDPAIARLDSAIGKGSIAEGTTLYRGMTREAAKKLFEGGTITKGADISDKAFASTSKSQGEASARGMGGVVIKIVAGKNAKGLDMTEHSDNKTEQEVLLPRNAKMKVTGITAPKSLGGHVIVHAVYGNDEDDE